MVNVTFGVRIPLEGWVPVTTKPADFKYFVRLARTAEASGYNSIFVADHLLNWIGSEPRHTAPPEFMALPIYESWTILSALAGLTEKVMLSNIVLCNVFRNPALLAKMASTLDIISNGRLVLAIGAAWFRDECRRYGLDWYPYRERIGRLRESVRIMRALWTQKTVNFDGTYYKLRDALLEPKPVTQPYPPIWLGGASENVMRIVADEGDGWDFSTSLQGTKAKIRDLTLYCDKISRNPKQVKISHSCMVILADTKDQAMDWVKAKVKDLNTTIESFMARHLVGSPSEIVLQMNEYVEAGVQHFTLYFDRDIKNIERFALEVIPKVT